MRHIDRTQVETVTGDAPRACYSTQAVWIKEAKAEGLSKASVDGKQRTSNRHSRRRQG